MSNVGSRVAYTEPLSARSILEFNYSISNNARKSQRTTLEKNGEEKYELIVDSLSNAYRFAVLNHSGGMNYRYAKSSRMVVSFGMNVAQAAFTRTDLHADSVSRYSFTNFTPGYVTNEHGRGQPFARLLGQYAGAIDRTNTTCAR